MATSAQKLQDAAAAKTAATTAVAQQQGAVQAAAAATKAVQTACSGTDTAACAQAQADLLTANQNLATATANAQSAVSAANTAASALTPSTSTGAGFSLCGNGMLAAICTSAMGGTSSSITTGITALLGGGSGVSGGAVSGLPGTYNTSGGVGGVATAKCGTNFSEIGGVCFPTNTGLSAAPIYVILSNLFSWLMGLFTTLAIVAFVISGIQYVTAAGSQDQMETAKRNATYAIFGIIVGLSGYIMIQAIAAALAGQSSLF